MFANPDNCSQFFFFFEKTSSKKCGLEICAGIKFIIGREGGRGKKVGREGSMIKLFCIMRALTNPYRSRTVAN